MITVMKMEDASLVCSSIKDDYVGQCDCGRLVFFRGETKVVCHCGKVYNCFGQELVTTADYEDGDEDGSV